MTQRLKRPKVKGKEREEFTSFQKAASARGQRWLLRGLLATAGWERLVLRLPEAAEEIDILEHLNTIGTGVCAFLEIDSKSLQGRALAQARRNLIRHYQKLARSELPDLPHAQLLMQEIGLTPLEVDLMAFALLANHQPDFQTGFGFLGNLVSPAALFEKIAVCLGVEVAQVSQAFARQGTLAASGLVTVSPNCRGNCDLNDWLDVLPKLSSQLDEPYLSTASLLSSYLKLPAEPPRVLADFAHLTSVISVLKPLLRGAIAEGVCGVNILLYGPTGTGKTALVNALACDLGLQLLEVSVADEDGDALERQGRVKALRLVGRLGASRGDALILFDEVEDYFRSGFRQDSWESLHPDGGPGKGYTVDLLQSAPAPTFWVTNDLESIDPAYRRRFNFVLEVGPPPPAVRANIAAQYLAPLGIDETGLRQRVAAHEHLPPGLIAQAAETTRLAQEADNANRARIFEATLNQHLAALDMTPLPQVPRVSLPYGLQYLALKTDPAALLEGLRSRAEGRLLFYGVPGSGKTALARHLAESLGLTYLRQRASDLLGPYVGETERAIAAMFQRARAQGALLVLDECDSFLSSRTRAHQSWEVSLVNEVLTQMEDYPGIFVATTNFLDALDEASLRRFDVKLEFLSLTPDKAAALFAAVLGRDGIALSDAEQNEWREQLRCLHGLTPGDYLSALRGLSLRNASTDARTLFDALAAECLLKAPEKSKQPMGFTGTPMRGSARIC